jgi:hypothetical protein
MTLAVSFASRMARRKGEPGWLTLSSLPPEAGERLNDRILVH